MLHLCNIDDMSRKKIPVKNATLRIPSGRIGHIGKFIPGIINSGDLPRLVSIYDPETNEEFEAVLVSIVPFQSAIPEALCFISEGKHPKECLQDILNRCNANSVNQLAFYVYNCQNSSTTLS